MKPGHRRLAAGLLLAAALLIVPGWLPVYPRFVLSLALVNAVAVMGVNISMGYAGLVSVGHAGFAAVGAYATALLMLYVDVPFWAALPASALLAGLVGCMIGLPALRLSPLYIAMVTFGFGQIVTYVSLNWLPVTGGPNGLVVPPVTLAGVELLPHTFYYAVAVVFLLAFWVSGNLAASRTGRGFLAIRTSELAAQAMGINLALYKTMAFAVGALYGGVAGSLYAGLSGYVNPDAFFFSVSILYLTMNVVGGMGTVAGPVLGAMLFTLLPELLRPFAEYREFLSGALLLAFLIFVPNGIVGALAALMPRLADWRLPTPRPLRAEAGHDR